MDLAHVIDRCVFEPGGCVSWKGAHDGKGYPHFSHEKRGHRVFRYLYETFVGPIPERHLLHHRCENKWCVNPFHGWPLTMSEHKAFAHPQLRATHCPNGHEFTVENTYWLKIKTRENNWQRKCRTCERERKSTPEYLKYMRDYYQRRKAGELA
jgi:hypothetical protein